MHKVTFSGSNSAQVASGEAVIITVTKPDTTTDTLTATTKADGSFTIDKDYPAGDYSAKSHQDKDADYGPWDSNDIPFTVPSTTRTGNLNVVVA